MISASPFVVELAERWLAAAGRASWQGGIALGLVWVACRLFPRLPARWRCWLWRLALLKLLLSAALPGTLDVPILPSAWSGATAPATAASRSEALAGSPAGADELAAPEITGPSVAGAIGPAAARAGIAWPVVLFAVWLAVVLGLVGLTLRRVFAARRWRRECVLVKDPRILALGEQGARDLGLVQPPLLLTADSCRSPVVFGAVRTSIVLPASLVSSASAEQMRLILAHEMAHIRRGDLLGNWYSTVVSALFFFHPLVWLAFRETRLAQEIACDELTLRQPGVSIGDYGRLIVDLATRCRRRGPAVVAVGVVESFHHCLERRLSAMKNFGTGSWRTLALVWLLALVAVFGLLPWRVVARDGPDAEDPGAKAPPAVLAETKSGPYTITVDRAQHDKGSRIMFSRGVFPITAGMTSGTTDSTSSQGTWTQTNAGGAAGGMAGGMGVGMGVGMGGGSASVFKKPNLVLDIALAGPKLSGGSQWLCTVAGAVRGQDERGRDVESPGMNPSTELRLSNVEYREGPGRTALHLYLPPDDVESRSLAGIEGALLVAQGTVDRVTFKPGELTRRTTKRGKHVAVRVDQFRQTPEGVGVVVAASPPAALQATAGPAAMMQDPMAHMRAVMAAHGRLRVALVDSQGRVRQPTSQGSTMTGGSGGGSGSSWSSTSGGQDSSGRRWSTTRSGRRSSGGASGSGFASGGFGANGGAAGAAGGVSGGASGGFGAGDGTSGGFGGPGVSMGAGGPSDGWPTQEIHFAPLPDGVTIKSLVCTVTDLTDEPKTVPFRLENIPLSE